MGVSPDDALADGTEIGSLREHTEPINSVGTII